jgi:hypothetical protein
MQRQTKPEARALVLVLLLTLAPASEAYLDPSTGSLILSAIVGLLATIGLALKTWWYKIKSLFRRNPASTEGDSTKSSRD